MSRPSLNEIRNTGDLAVLFRWNFIVTTLPSALQNPPSTEQLNQRCESFEPPTRTGQTILNNIRGHQDKQSGIWTYNPFTITFVDTVDNIINEFIHNWVELAWATKTGVAVPKLQQQSTIILQQLDNEDNPIVEYKCVGCIPEAEDKGGTRDGATSDVARPTLTLVPLFYERTSLI